MTAITVRASEQLEKAIVVLDHASKNPDALEVAQKIIRRTINMLENISLNDLDEERELFP
jgi:hypothetical protein